MMAEKSCISIYKNHYTSDIIQPIYIKLSHKNDATGANNKALHLLTLNKYVNVTLAKSDISPIIKPISTKCSVRIMTPLYTGIVAFMCADPHFFALEMMAFPLLPLLPLLHLLPLHECTLQISHLFAAYRSNLIRHSRPPPTD